MSDRTLFEVYLRPWREFVRHGGRGVMVSHNLVGSLPMHGNAKMLKGVLRGRFGLGNGYIGSDNGNVKQLTEYGFTSDGDDATTVYMEAGGDQAMPGMPSNPAGLINGTLAATDLDRAAANVLRTKVSASTQKTMCAPGAVSSLARILSLPSQPPPHLQFTTRGLTAHT